MSHQGAVPDRSKVAQAQRRALTLAHQALLYRGDDDYLAGVLGFVAPGVHAGEPIAVAVPRPRAALLREPLAALDPGIAMLDMVEVGRNPARIIPAMQAMLAHSGGRLLHYVGEPIWPGRSAAEVREAIRHEALINLAWPGAEIRALCLYDADRLDADVLGDAEQTHPWVIRAGEGGLSPRFTGATVPPSSDQPLADPPEGAVSLAFGLDDLSRLRTLVTGCAAAAGLERPKVTDLILAVNEVATNSLKHAEAPGRMRVWAEPDGIACQLEDPGHIADPLVGRRRPAPSVEGGLGLWMVNQLCDLVEVRTSARGTVIRLHMARG
jgi:anti-sigma regulatory factor (Ser/Thr protein kinase)